ncbi:MAG: MarR family winged helix-turn-helix transcriptional regulator [Gracilibacteraceae bacterium]|jgi:DNA-binding MarR family transcriptional regulator|nr:MarR family winged helix-turn-helix transcriptional regulator [Gracilibacteraceae bacterium]
MNIKRDTEKCYCINFRKAARALTAYYDRALLPSGVTITQYSLLINLFRAAPCSVTALAKIMKLERTTLVRNIRPLAKAGLIRDLSAAGGRDRQLTLTEKGLITLEAAQRLWEKAQANLKKQVGEKEMEKLLNAIAEVEDQAKTGINPAPPA